MACELRGNSVKFTVHLSKLLAGLKATEGPLKTPLVAPIKIPLFPLTTNMGVFVWPFKAPLRTSNACPTASSPLAPNQTKSGSNV